MAEIDGVVTRRNVNPGNNVVAGQSVMALRSLTDIWIDANFKETQLSRIRIGQPVDLDVDMYGSHKMFKGRVEGFTFGTGSTLAILPPENATGNFVKVVQRLPVRVNLVDYDPDKRPLFVGLSVTPYVYINATPTGPDAGKVLRPTSQLPLEPLEPKVPPLEPKVPPLEPKVPPRQPKLPLEKMPSAPHAHYADSRFVEPGNMECRAALRKAAAFATLAAPALVVIETVSIIQPLPTR